MRLVFRIPRLAYDLNVGWLFGHRIVLIVHRGRKSGRIYRTALEAVRYEPATRTSIVISAWGERSDWFRNIRARTAIEIQTGHDRYVPEQHILSLDETDAELTRYVAEHRFLAKILGRVFGFRLDAGPDVRRAFAESVRMVAFRPPSDRQSTR